jgi:hypothetical protein
MRMATSCVAQEMFFVLEFELHMIHGPWFCCCIIPPTKTDTYVINMHGDMYIALMLNYYSLEP